MKRYTIEISRIWNHVKWKKLRSFKKFIICVFIQRLFDVTKVWFEVTCVIICLNNYETFNKCL